MNNESHSSGDLEKAHSRIEQLEMENEALRERITQLEQAIGSQSHTETKQVTRESVQSGPSSSPPRTGRDSSDGGTETPESTQVTANSSNYKTRGRIDDGNGIGVLGQNDADNDTPVGVRGVATADATTASTYGVEGISYANADSSSSVNPAGIRGVAKGIGTAYGIYGRGESKETQAVVGDATESGGYAANNDVPTGVLGVTDRSVDDNVTGAYGVAGLALGTSGKNYGAYGFSKSPDGYGVYGKHSSDGYGVYSEGDARVTGKFSAKTRSIDQTGVSVYADTEQSIATSTSKKVTFDQTAYSDRGSFNSSTNVFTAPESGRYQIESAVTFDTSVDKIAVCAIAINGTVKALDRRTITNSLLVNYGGSPKVTKTVDLSKDDEVSTKAWHYTGSESTIVSGESLTYMTIEQLS